MMDLLALLVHLLTTIAKLLGPGGARAVVVAHYRPGPGDGGPSWFTFVGHARDSLWSIDLFRCESILLNTHWVLMVMDQFTRRIVGFAVHAGDSDGVALCRMFNNAISTMGSPKYLSSDNDPLFQYHQWQANLRILSVDEIKTVPYTPISHPFIERLIGTIRREFLDQTLFWNAVDLGRKLDIFKITTTVRVRMHLSMAIRPLKSAVTESPNPLRCTATCGKSIVAVCFNSPFAA